MTSNDSSPDRSYQQLPNAVSGYDIGGGVFIPQPVSISASYPGMQVVKVTGPVDRIYIQPIRGQAIIIDALTASKTIDVQASAADASAPLGAKVATVPGGSFGILVSSESGWFFSSFNSNGEVYIPVDPNGLDQTQQIQDAVNQCAGSCDIRLGPGTFLIGLVPGIRVPSNSALRGTVGATVLKSTMPAVGGFPGNYIFYADAIQVQLGSLVATPSVGDSQVICTQPTRPAAGNSLQISHHESCEVLEILSARLAALGTTNVTAAGLYGGGGTLNGLTLDLTINGVHVALVLNGATNTANQAAFFAAIAAAWAGAKAEAGGTGGLHLVISALQSVTVGVGSANAALGLAPGAVPTTWLVSFSEPIVFPWVSTDPTIELSDVPHDITFEDLTFAGTGDESVEMARVVRPVMRRIRYIPDYGVVLGACIGYDVGCTKGLAEDFDLDLTGSIIGCVGFYQQSCKYTTSSRLFIQNAILIGASLIDCYGCILDKVNTVNCGGRGQSIGAFSILTYGSFECVSSNCRDVGSPTGLYVGEFSTYRTQVSNWGSLKNNTYGLLIGANSHSTQVVNSVLKDDATGLYVSAGSTGTLIKSIDTSGSDAGINTGGDVDIDGWFHDHGVKTTQVSIFGAGTITRLRGAYVLATSVFPGGVVLQANGARLEMRESSITTDATSNLAVYVTAGVFYMDTTKIVANRGVDCNNGITLRIGSGNNLSGCVTGLPPNGAKFVSRGTVASNAAVAVAVPWPNIEASDTVIPFLSTRGGTCVGGMPLVTITPGVGFSFTGVASDAGDTVWGFRLAS